MSLTDPENNRGVAPDDEVLAATQSLIASLPAADGLQEAIDEGRETAAIIEPLGLPGELLAAARLYPLYREGFVADKELNNNNLTDISRIIINLRQLHQFSLPQHWRPGEALAVRQSEALRKMLLAVVADVRLVLLRIAQQLYSLRAAKQAPADRRYALAMETREIYASLANRLGVWQLKWELEDLAFRYLDPNTYLEIARTLKETRREREAFIESVKETLRSELGKHGIDAEISGRPKHIYSIWRKMQRKDRGIESLFDIRALRSLVRDVGACYAALGVVHNLWPYIPGEFDDYIANPKDNDYRSLHTAVVGPEGKTIEVQIRSHEMHRHAELGVAAHWRYKEGGTAPAAFEQKIQFLRRLLEPSDDGADLIGQIRDEFFEDRVYAISPKGDVVELPAGATPLDFAYHVHTQVGHRCRGAKVNGRIVPLTHRIESGDQVEIITGKEAKPSRDWLSPRTEYLASARSRAKVRNWFRHQDRDQHLRQGRDILDRELARLGGRDTTIERLARQLKMKDAEALFVALGAGDLAPAAIATALNHLRGDEHPDRFRGRRAARSRHAKPDSEAISGVGDLLCNFARCCRPVPPESIGGYITQGRGVTIHRRDCGNFLRLNEKQPERVLEINWGEQDSGSYPADLTLHAFDRSGLIRDITAVLADVHANVTAMQSRTDKKSMQTVMDISVEIADLPTLKAAISRLEQLPNVVYVRRKT